jgi:DNA ligase-1
MTAYYIKKLNESDSRIHKEQVLEQALSYSELGEDNSIWFLTLLALAYNPFVTFGVKKTPVTRGITGAINPWSELNELLHKLHNRELTGNAARDAIEEISHKFDSDNWNEFVAGVINKDVRAGISEKTINKICKGTQYEVPVFTCQLATNCEGRPEMRGKNRIEAKLDGVRMLAVVSQNDTVTCYSRNGKVFENFGVIEEQIRNHARIFRAMLGCGDFVFDGEVMGQSFQDLMRQARRKKDADAADSVYHVFDFIPLVDFNRGYWNAQLHKRITKLERCQSAFDGMPNVELTTGLEVDLDTSEGQDQMRRYSSDCVNKGYEGIMIKSLDAPYICKRSTFWLKWKPVHDYDLKVLGFEEGTGRNLGRLGAIICEGVDDNKHIRVNCGSGYSDSDRDNLWRHKQTLVGQTIVVAADAVTQNQDGTYSLRFPRFVRFRDDK